MNFVILDYDREEDSRLARRLGVHAHPAFAVVAPDGRSVTSRQFGPLEEGTLRKLLDSAASSTGSAKP